MNYFLFSKHLIIASLAVFLFAGVDQVLTVHHFPIFGIVNGAQTARINAVLVEPPEPDVPCPVSLVFIDSEGHSIGDPTIFQLRGGASVHLDFIGDPNSRVGERLEIGARVTYDDPGEFPGCASGVQTSVEIVDRFTRATRIILTNPVVRQVPR